MTIYNFFLYYFYGYLKFYVLFDNKIKNDKKIIGFCEKLKNELKDVVRLSDIFLGFFKVKNSFDDEREKKIIKYKE